MDSAKKKSGRVTSKGGAPIGRLSGGEDAGLNDIFARILRSARADLTDDLEPLGVEVWASQMWAIWQRAAADRHGRHPAVPPGSSTLPPSTLHPGRSLY